MICPVVVSVECEEDYVLSVAFESGETGLLDMKPYLDFGIFGKIRDPKVFGSVRVSSTCRARTVRLRCRRRRRSAKRLPLRRKRHVMSAPRPPLRWRR